MTLSSVYKQNRLFFAGYFLLIILALALLVGFQKVEGHVFLNPWHYRLLDYVFRVFTILGDGLFIISFAILLFLFKNKFLALMVIAGYVLSGIPVQIIKSYIDAPRPALFLKEINYSHFVEGVTLHNYNSFPSGHTASAFALAVILAITIKNKWIGLIILFLAALVGYSRIYLSQHFMEDVFAGSLIGVLSGVATYLFLEKWIRKITSKKEKDRQKS